MFWEKCLIARSEWVITTSTTAHARNQLRSGLWDKEAALPDIDAPFTDL